MNMLGCMLAIILRILIIIGVMTTFRCVGLLPSTQFVRKSIVLSEALLPYRKVANLSFKWFGVQP